MPMRDVKVPVDALGRETRVFEARMAADGLKLSGYAAVFNSRSVKLWDFYEVIKPGAFKRALANGADVRALLNHDANFVFGRTKSGTLALAEDETGLRADITPPDAQWARDQMESVKRGDVDQMSFAFRVMPGGDTWQMDGNDLVRELTDVELFDVSVVTYPAYPETTVAVRSIDVGGGGSAQKRSIFVMHRRLELAEVDFYGGQK